MTFILRLVILETTGRPGIILDKRRLEAITVEDAKIEADRTPWKIGGIEPTSLEIVDSEGLTVARRRYAGPNLYSPWANL
jgi:hypothetical protein